MERLPAIAAFANAVLQLAVAVAFAFTLIFPSSEASGWRAIYMLHAVPIPLVTATVLLGLVTHPATKDVRRVVWLGAVLMGIAAAISCAVASMGLSALGTEFEIDAAMLVVLSVFPVVTLSGVGATLIGDRLMRARDTPSWLAGLGALALLAGSAAYTGYAAVFVSLSAFAAWWALLGVVLSFYKPPQAALT